MPFPHLHKGITLPTLQQVQKVPALAHLRKITAILEDNNQQPSSKIRKQSHQDQHLHYHQDHLAVKSTVEPRGTVGDEATTLFSHSQSGLKALNKIPTYLE